MEKIQSSNTRPVTYKPQLGNNRPQLKRNNEERKQSLLKQSKNDVNVTIPEKIKDFARIKSVIDQGGIIDNSAQIALLKKKIKDGTYSVDFEALADKMLEKEW